MDCTPRRHSGTHSLHTLTCLLIQCTCTYSCLDQYLHSLELPTHSHTHTLTSHSHSLELPTHSHSHSHSHPHTTHSLHTPSTTLHRGPASEWYDALQPFFILGPAIRHWFADTVFLKNRNRFSEYLLECPSAEVMMTVKSRS